MLSVDPNKSIFSCFAFYEVTLKSVRGVYLSSELDGFQEKLLA